MRMSSGALRYCMALHGTMNSPAVWAETVRRGVPSDCGNAIISRGAHGGSFGPPPLLGASVVRSGSNALRTNRPIL